MQRTGIRLIEGGLPFREVVRLAQDAESRGADSIFFNGGGFMQLAALGPVTKSVRLVTGVATIYTASPQQLAQQALVLDRVSGGRAVLGIGTGHPEAAVAAGIVYEKPLDRMREYASKIREIVSRRMQPGGSPGVFQQQTVRTNLPIWAAAMQLRMCELGGEVGDGVLLNWPTPSYAPRAVEAVRQGAIRAGRDPSSIEIACYIRVAPRIADDATYRAMALDIASYVSRSIYRSHFRALGLEAESEAIVAAYAESPERGAALVSDAMMEDFAAIGDEACRARLKEYRDAGFTLPVLAPLASDDAADWQAVLDLL